MGKLVEGKWVDVWYETEKSEGKFERSETQFRDLISPGSETFVPQTNRYHLYISNACPWAHRTIIMRQLKSLESLITVSVVHPHMLSKGWEFRPQGPYQDHLYNSEVLFKLYLRAKSKYSGRVTVPILWDKESETIVNNESSDIIRIFNTAFNDITGNELDFYPKSLQNDINSINDKVYHTVNNGVYRCGFATKQDAYEQAFEELFCTLDELDNLLKTNKFLVGDQLTEADIRLFTTLIRFDLIYYSHFKCNFKRIQDYPSLFDYLKRLLNRAEFKQTTYMDDIKQHYFYSHDHINPTRIVPKGPSLDWFPRNPVT